MAKRGYKSKNLKMVFQLLFILGIGYLILNLGKKCYAREGLEGQKELLLMHMDGCPHCVKMMPDWNAASKENKSGIKMRAVEQSQGEGPALCKKHDVSGFPTVLLLKDGKKVDTYDGDRTKSGFLSYLNNQ
jgi:thiol-disulfide isomerase/thioredoxin